MRPVTCPTCRKWFDPGLDDHPNDLPDNLSMKVVCPYCDQWVRLPEGDPIDEPALPPQVLDQMRSQSRRLTEDDDRPRRRRRDEDDDRPRRRSSQEEDDYGDDFRPGRRKADGLGQAAMWTGIGSLAVTCVVLLFGCLCFPPLAIVSVLGMIGGIVAIIMGFMARSRVPGSGAGLTGILTGFGTLLIGIAMIVLAVIGAAMFMKMAPPPAAGPAPVGNPAPVVKPEPKVKIRVAPPEK
jgi:hypothetical protein